MTTTDGDGGTPCPGCRKVWFPFEGNVFATCPACRKPDTSKRKKRGKHAVGRRSSLLGDPSPWGENATRALEGE